MSDNKMADNVLKRKRAESGLPTPLTPISPTFKREPSATVGKPVLTNVDPICADGAAIIILKGLFNEKEL